MKTDSEVWTVLWWAILFVQYIFKFCVMSKFDWSHHHVAGETYHGTSSISLLYKTNKSKFSYKWIWKKNPADLLNVTFWTPKLCLFLWITWSYIVNNSGNIIRMIHILFCLLLINNVVMTIKLYLLLYWILRQLLKTLLFRDVTWHFRVNVTSFKKNNLLIWTVNCLYIST